MVSTKTKFIFRGLGYFASELAINVGAFALGCKVATKLGTPPPGRPQSLARGAGSAFVGSLTTSITFVGGTAINTFIWARPVWNQLRQGLKELREQSVNQAAIEPRKALAGSKIRN